MKAARALKPRALGLRLRLTLTYVIFFSLLLLGLGLLFRETLQFTLHQNATDVLDEEWAAVKGYLRIERNRPIWFFDPADQEETFIVQRLRRVFLLMDKKGGVLEVSSEYNDLGVEPVAELRDIVTKGKPIERVRKSKKGEPYLVRTGLYTDPGKREFILSIGRSLERDEMLVHQFMQQYFSAVPLLVLGIGAAGWLMAGRALSPLNDVAHAASSITGHNLSLRIPLRGAGDELDHLIERFNGMVDRLEQSFTQVRQFSIDVSHELRTPITAIRGELEVALITAQTPDQFREAIMAAMEDCDRLGKVVRALLQLSQAETGQVTLAREQVDLSAIVESVVEQFQIAAEVEGLQLSSTLEPACCVRGDRVQLERLVSNLLSNAVKYTPGGGTIDVRVSATNESVALIVADTGRGIPPEFQPKIFERFYRVPDDNRDPEKGLGLGLSFVAWIAKVHDATIDLKSAPGVGTTFTVTFPRDRGETEAPTQASDRIVA